ncbi:MAG: GEVED domain-containing protein, partial [Chitinophagales bacterium]
MRSLLYNYPGILLFSLFLTLLQPANAQYCTPLYSNSCLSSNDFINNFTFGTLSNNGSGCNGNINNYINYAPTGTFTASVELGASYNISLQSGNQWPEGFGVWIDFNNDNDFDDADEFIYASPSVSTNQFTGSVIIPSNSDYVGDHRMRVRCKFSGIVSSTESCTTFNYGETEDYTLSILPATTSMTYVSSTVTQNNLDAVGLGASDVEIISIQVITAGTVNPLILSSLTINSNGSTNFANDVAAVKLYYTGNNSAFSTDQLYATVSDLSLPVSVNATLALGTNYFWIAYDITGNAFTGDTIDAACTQLVLTGSGGTQIPSVTAPAGFREINYCFPTYTEPCSSGDFIDNLSFNTLSNSGSGCNGNANNYIYYTPAGNLTTTVETGSNYAIALQAGEGFIQGFGVWIDYNNDLDFADADEFVYASPVSGTELFVGEITIPDNPAYLGEHLMRVRCIYNNVPAAGDFCNNQNRGETEDYTITVSQPSSMFYQSATTTQTNLSDVLIGSVNQEIIGVEVVVSGSNDPFNFTSLTVNSNGTSDFTNDVTNVKVYYTGNNPIFSSATLFGSATNLSTPITGSVNLVSGVNHFWVTYDISPTAVIGHYVDAECTQVVMSTGGTQVPVVTAPAGSRQVGYCTAAGVSG